MVVLNFVVRGSVLSARGKLPQVTTRSNKFFTLNVELDDVWSEYTVTVFFSNKAKPDAAEDVFPVLLHDGSCIVPHEVLDASDITAYMWLMGLKDDVRATTNIITIPLTASGYLEGVAPEEPTPDVYTEILESVRGAYNIANDVRADADAGKFNGKPGVKGDPGVGVPPGGATGQVLAKASDADYDTEWCTPSGGGSGNITVDAALDDTSENPVQNKAIKKYIDDKVAEAGSNITVDAALSGTSTNPVQNKAVKAALDGKLDKTGGTLTGNLKVTGALFSGDGLSFGTGENIHFTKAADDAGKLAHGAAGIDDTVPLARLKVAAPTEDDDAATKAYVDGRAAGTGAVRYDAAQTLTEAQQFQARKNIGAVGHNSPQFQGYLALAPANETLGSGVGLSPTGSGHNYTLDISDVDESNPTLLTGVKTPTDADNSAAANVEYVKAKVAGASGGTANAVLYTEQTLTDAQKKQARENVGAAATTFVITANPHPDGAATTDKTFSQIKEAVNAGKTAIARVPDGDNAYVELPLLELAANDCTFGVFSAGARGVILLSLNVADDGSSFRQANLPLSAVLYTEQALTNPQQVQARKNIGALGAVTPTITGGLFILESEPAGTPIQVQSVGSQQSATGEEYAEVSITNTSPQAASENVILTGLADFGDAEAVGRTDTAVSYAQLMNYTKPLMLTYDNNKVTGASYYEIRKAIERGRQIKLAVANTADIIAANAKNETDKSVLKFIETDVGGDTVFFKQYYVTAQTSGITVNTKSMELP